MFAPLYQDPVDSTSTFLDIPKKTGSTQLHHFFRSPKCSFPADSRSILQVKLKRPSQMRLKSHVIPCSPRGSLAPSTQLSHHCSPSQPRHLALDFSFICLFLTIVISSRSSQPIPEHTIHVATCDTTMPVGFGFSASDFISALSLVATVIDAVRECGESSSEYRALIAQLHTLQGALVRVKALGIDDAQQGDLVIALQQAAAQCQTTIDGFWQRIAKYQPSLREGGSGSRVKDGWMKIRWAVCKKDDLVKFKMDLIGHTESIEMLLTALHL